MEAKNSKIPEVFNAADRVAAREGVSPLTLEYINRLEGIALAARTYWTHTMPGNAESEEASRWLLKGQQSISSLSDN